MADRVYSLVKGPAGWVLFLDAARVGGVYGTKEAAFEAVMVAASYVSVLATAFRSTCPAMPIYALAKNRILGQRNGARFSSEMLYSTWWNRRTS
jgi:hypothetical protein